MTQPVLFFASWYDPGDNGFDIGDAGLVLGFLLALAGVWAVISSATRKIDSWRDRRHRIDVESIMKPHLDALDQRLVEQTSSLADTIREATKPIQPTTNGGLSLADAHVTLNRIEGKVDAVDGRLTSVEVDLAAAKVQRSATLRIGAANLKTITDAVTALGAEIELLPFDKPDDHH